MDAKTAEKLEKDAEVTEPWIAANILTVSKELKEYLASQGLRGRWKTKANIDKARLEGWVPFTVKDPNTAARIKTMIDGTPMGTTIEKRGLIFCVLPLTRVKAREAYHKDLTDSALPDKVDEFKKSVAKEGHGARAYGEIKVQLDEVKGGK